MCCARHLLSTLVIILARGSGTIVAYSDWCTSLLSIIYDMVRTTVTSYCANELSHDYLKFYLHTLRTNSKHIMDTAPAVALRSTFGLNPLYIDPRPSSFHTVLIFSSNNQWYIILNIILPHYQLSYLKDWKVFLYFNGVPSELLSWDCIRDFTTSKAETI